MILRPLCTWQRWISAKPPKVSRTTSSALGTVDDEQSCDIRLQPTLDQVGQQRFDHGGVVRRPLAMCAY
jgi:hypothetical protein